MQDGVGRRIIQSDPFTDSHADKIRYRNRSDISIMIENRGSASTCYFALEVHSGKAHPARRSLLNRIGAFASVQCNTFVAFHIGLLISRCAT